MNGWGNNTCAVLIGFSSASLCAQESIEIRIEKLEKEIETLKEEQSSNVVQKPQVSSIRFAGLVQMDFNQFDGVYNAQNNGVSGSDVLVRRIHFRVFHQYDDQLDYVMLFTGTDDNTKLLVGFARYKFNDSTQISIGKLKEDRSLSAQYIGEEMTAERPMVANAFALGFHWGAQGHKVFENGVRFSAGIFEDKKYAGDQDGRDANNKLELAYNSRITWSKSTLDDVLHIGGSGSYRNLGDESFSISGIGGVKSASNDIVLSPTLNTASSADIFLSEFAWQKKAFRLEAEYGIMEVNSDTENNIALQGYYISANYFLDGNTYTSYNKTYARFGRPSNEKNKWAIYARYSAINLIDNDAGSKATVAMLGTTFYYNESVNFQMQYSKADISGPDVTLSPFTNINSGEVYNKGDALTARISYRF
jgi:phosphate-selective porin OprO/OprP